MRRPAAIAFLAGAITGHLTNDVGEAGLTPPRNVRATAYCSGQVTAAGTSVRFGDVALPSRSHLAWGRRIYILHGVYNPRSGHRHRWFFGRDIIGWGSTFDLYLPWGAEPDCSWGRKLIAYRVWT